jgi:hypothetical protein
VGKFIIEKSYMTKKTYKVPSFTDQPLNDEDMNEDCEETKQSERASAQ